MGPSRGLPHLAENPSPSGGARRTPKQALRKKSAPRGKQEWRLSLIQHFPLTVQKAVSRVGKALVLPPKRLTLSTHLAFPKLHLQGGGIKERLGNPEVRQRLFRNRVPGLGVFLRVCSKGIPAAWSGKTRGIPNAPEQSTGREVPISVGVSPTAPRIPTKPNSSRLSPSSPDPPKKPHAGDPTLTPLACTALWG